MDRTEHGACPQHFFKKDSNWLQFNEDYDIILDWIDCLCSHAFDISNVSRYMNVVCLAICRYKTIWFYPGVNMSETFHFSLQPSETIIFQAATNIYASYIVAGQVTDENQVIKMKEAITTSISLANYVQSIVESDDQISGQARQSLSNTVREEVNMPHV